MTPVDIQRVPPEVQHDYYVSSIGITLAARKLPQIKPQEAVGAARKPICWDCIRFCLVWFVVMPLIWLGMVAGAWIIGARIGRLVMEWMQ